MSAIVSFNISKTSSDIFSKVYNHLANFLYLKNVLVILFEENNVQVALSDDISKKIAKLGHVHEKCKTELNLDEDGALSIYWYKHRVVNFCAYWKDFFDNVVVIGIDGPERLLFKTSLDNDYDIQKIIDGIVRKK